jgi:hypothetical protein
MRILLRAVVAVVALVVFAVPSLANAASTATIPTRQLTAKGGKVTMSVTVKSPGWCVWSSSPKVPKFNLSQRCNAGKVTRSAMIGPNLSAKGKDYTLSLKLVAKSPVVDDLKVVEAEQIPPTTTTTSTTTTTTTTPTTVPPTTTSTTTSPTTPTTTTTSTTTTSTTLPPVSFPGLTSNNWSGYVLTQENYGVSAYWTVPTLDCASVPDGVTSDWVGVNGLNGADDLFQDGTSSNCQNGLQSDLAWWTDEAAKYAEQPVFAVAPGDVISAEVYLDVSGYWVYEITDQTSRATSSAAELFSGPGATAEWIAEDPGDPITGGLYPLANFGSVTFTNLGLTLMSGSWTLPPYSDAWEMVTPEGSVEALPSPIQGSGASSAFTVTYEPPGELGSAARTAVMEHPQSTFLAPPGE